MAKERDKEEKRKKKFVPRTNRKLKWHAEDRILLEDPTPELDYYLDEIDYMKDIIEHFWDDFEKDPNDPQLVSVSHIVKEQLSTKLYAKITPAQKKSAEQKLYDVLYYFVEGHSYQLFSNDIMKLLHAYYPLFYWNDRYTTIRSQFSRHSEPYFFIVPNEYCRKLAVFSLNNAPSSFLKIENIEHEILDLVFIFLSRRYYYVMKMRESTDEYERGWFESSYKTWEEKYLSDMGKKSLYQLNDAANQMRCKSLTRLTNRKIESIENQTDDFIESLLIHHFSLKKHQQEDAEDEDSFCIRKGRDGTYKINT